MRYGWKQCRYAANGINLPFWLSEQKKPIFEYGRKQSSTVQVEGLMNSEEITRSPSWSQNLRMTVPSFSLHLGSAT